MKLTRKLLILLLTKLVHALLDPVPIVVVKSVVNYGRASFSRRPIEQRTKPAPVSGVVELANLSNTCFNLESAKYRYEFCPFANVTQQETISNFREFSAVIGVWSGHWSIEDNTFKGMLFDKGDPCGQTNRSAVVSFTCGEDNALIDAVETSQCFYELTFKTFLACNNQIFMVYPKLNETLRRRWDLIETKRAASLLTAKGYKQELNRLFFEAGYVEEKMNAPNESHPFSDLQECNRQYLKLQNQMKH